VTRQKRFSVAGGTLPSADEALDVTTSRPHDVAAPAASGNQSAGRTAFTWRLTADQALTLDDLTLQLKRQLGRGRLDRAELLAALTDLAHDNSAVFAALVAQLQAGQAS
jgi:hypothetical protein